MKNIGFDKEKYLEIQSKHILERISQFENKLYLEFGGKIFADLHGSRVLPGFEPDIKINLLQKLKDKTEIVLAINAEDIELNRIEGDFGLSYSENLTHFINKLRTNDLYVSSVVITRFSGQGAAIKFKSKLEKLGVKVYIHYFIKDYPTNVNHIMSDEGFGKNDYIETTRQLVIVAGAGSNSGKMATCMSQLYHEFKRGVKAGYAKYEKFPVWNLSINHPINLAYESATTNINDKNMIDPFHLEAYGEQAVNYNRDIEAFPILNSLLKKFWGKSPYNSPTDMGVNMIKECIVNEEVCIEAAKQEIIRRYFSRVVDEYVYGGYVDEIKSIEFLMNRAGVSPTDRYAVQMARTNAEENGCPAVAITLKNGKTITGKKSELLSASSAALLNSLKELIAVSDDVDLISGSLITPIQQLNSEYIGISSNLRINEVLIALATSTTLNPTAQSALKNLKELKGSEAHSTEILPEGELTTFKKLGINITHEP